MDHDLGHMTTTSDTRLDALCAQLDRDGYALIEDAWPADAVANARTELNAILETTPFGRDDFEGHQTRRVYALFGKTRTLDAAAVHPLVLGVLDRVLGTYQLSAPTGIEIGPGESAQAVCTPTTRCIRCPRPHGELVVNVMWPLDDFTEANGDDARRAGQPSLGRRAPDRPTPRPARSRCPPAPR